MNVEKARIESCDHLNGALLTLVLIPYGTTLAVLIAALLSAHVAGMGEWYSALAGEAAKHPLTEGLFLLGVPLILFWVHNWYFVQFIRRLWLRNHPGLSRGWASVLCYATYGMPGVLHAVLLLDPMWRLRRHGARMVAGVTAVLLIAGSWQFLKLLPESVLLAVILGVMVLLLIFSAWNYVLLAETRLSGGYAGAIGVLLVLTFANVGATLGTVRGWEREQVLRGEVEYAGEQWREALVHLWSEKTPWLGKYWGAAQYMREETGREAEEK